MYYNIINNKLNKNSMGIRKGSASINAGTTKQARGNTGAEKKTREKKTKMLPQEIEDKYGIKNKTLN